MSGGGGEGNTWIGILIGGMVLCGAGYGMEAAGVESTLLATGCLALGGLGVVFGSCEAMIKCVEGVGDRLGWNPFVAGTLAGLASNLPEIVMLGFVVAAAPRIAFVVVALTLHVNALVFGIYSGLLPRDEQGGARLPEALVKISTDLYAAGGGAFLAMGSIMLLMVVFQTGDHGGEGFGVWDLVATGVLLIVVQVVATTRMVQRFSKQEGDDDEEEAPKEPNPDAPSWGKIAVYGLVGIGTSILGGHAVGDFADVLVGAMNDAGYPEMFGAIILSVFAGAGAFVMVATAHSKRMYDIALAGMSGAITQVPFLVLPAVMLLIALLAQLGVVPTLDSGAVLPIDLETTSVILLAAPPMFILWKSIQDDGKVNWVETAGMVAVFGLIVYFLAQHG
ncbi:MAG: hypothetical protein AB8I08_25790 [Sandaracinaceae bacterium]